MNILLIQLPLLDHSLSYIHGNIEYAPAAIKGYIDKRFDHNVHLLPSFLANFASDSYILKYLEVFKPDIVGFTSYLWNIERNLYLASLIKKANKNITIVLSGPEIEYGSMAFFENQAGVNYFVSGEGEWFFNLYLSGNNFESYMQTIHDNILITQPLDDLIPVQDIVEPYTSRLLNTGLDGTVYLEFTRGCPFRCSYCFYSKRAIRTRDLPFDILIKAFSISDSLKEIYILSPTFNASPDFTERLKTLTQSNPGINLHTEMRAEGITDETAQLLYDAGFRSLEVGLQTLNEKALTCIGRKSDPGLELKGMAALKKAGINLKIGIIPGLPDDDPDNFIATVDTLVALGFKDEIELYPLMVLPGTAIRDYSEERNFKFQTKAPYYFISSENFSHKEMRYISTYVENKTGYYRKIDQLPHFTYHENGLLSKGIILDGDILDNWNCEHYREKIETNTFNFNIKIDKIESIYEGLPFLMSSIPKSELFNLVFYNNTLISEQNITNIMNQYEEDSFFRRLHIFDSWAEGLRLRFYQMFSDFSIYEMADVSYLFIEPILKINEENLNYLHKKTGNDEINLFVPEGMYEKCSSFLIQNFNESAERIAFESEPEQLLFYESISYQYSAFPYSFKMSSI